MSVNALQVSHTQSTGRRPQPYHHHRWRRQPGGPFHPSVWNMTYGMSMICTPRWMESQTGKSREAAWDGNHPEPCGVHRSDSPSTST